MNAHARAEDGPRGSLAQRQARLWWLSLAALALAGGACGQPATGGPDAAEADAAVSDIDGAIDAAPVASLSVLSLNLHCLITSGTSFADNRARLAAVAAAVADHQVDVVLAQEVCVSATEDARALLTAALASATGVTWSVESTLAHRAWAGTPDQADEYVAIFARGALMAPSATVLRDQGALRRVLLGATVATPVGAIRMITVHLDHLDDAVRAGQGRELASVATVETDDLGLGAPVGDGVALPVLAAGDFNSLASAAAPRALAALGFVEVSGSAATTRIDHVFVHRSAPLVARAATELFTGSDAVSDHPGVLVRFEVAAPTPVQLTRIVAAGTYPAPLSVRGDAAPLDWSRGWPAVPRAHAGGVAFVTSELAAGPFAYKFLRRDTDWQLGANATGTGHADNTSTPTF